VSARLGRRGGTINLDMAISFDSRALHLREWDRCIAVYLAFPPATLYRLVAAIIVSSIAK
jgi:hypothetical protein